MKKIRRALYLLVLISGFVYPQQLLVTGSVADKITGEPLAFANIRVIGSPYGASSNRNGGYELKLPKGSYYIAASFLGYHTDTIYVEAGANKKTADFHLLPSSVNLPEVTVLPGVNPAIEVIKNAIRVKKERDEKLQSYQFEAYAKGVARTPEKQKIKKSSDDKSKIAGILESHSKGFYKKPGRYKDVVLARKESANIPPIFNMLTGGQGIQNFYENRIELIDVPLTGPLADDALDYYYYAIEDTLSIDNINVFKIAITPDDPGNPGFTGHIYITDRSFNLIKVDLNINRAANTGGLIDSLNIVQTLSAFDNSIYMPADYRLFVNVSLMKLAKLSFELNTILYNYEINKNIDDSFFNKAIVTVLPGADKKDSLYWTGIQSIQNTSEENIAYAKIDSVKKAPKTFWNKFSFLTNRFNITENFATSTPLSLYHFNRVEGHSLDVGLFLHDLADSRFNTDIQTDYGFSDKRFKTDFTAAYFAGDYRTYKFSFNAYNKLRTLFDETNKYNELTNTLVAWFSKKELRDYYYSKGINVNIDGDVFPVVSAGLGFSSSADKNAVKRSDFSLTNKERVYKENSPIYETNINVISAKFNFDFRDYIEDGLYRYKYESGESYATFGGEIDYSAKNMLNSGLDFTTYKFNAFASFRSFKSTNATLSIKGEITDGALPYQRLYSLPGNIDAASQLNSFRTLQIYEVVGDRVITANFSHEFRDVIFRFLHIPYLKSAEIYLTYFFNAAYCETGNKSKEILPVAIKSFPHPFYETGFSVGRALFPIQLEFAWKLNYRDGNNYRISLNSAIF